MAKPKAVKEQTLAQKITAMLAAKDQGKEAYGRADELLQDVTSLMQVGQIVELGGGVTAELADNFAKKNKAWKPCGINRFDIKVSRSKGAV